ncbi:MAG: hypothetical protein H0Z18_07400 [Thermococcus sp.]|uniref:hypothetical protein n=1 Tax=Thermococcus sp. TaxID=35749 RepID=UPI001DC56F60|nr:hypothetical protein [Thermococcus sp.]MBO8175066.1 hypothetical protein [Thermococcus sp.]
MPYIPPAKILIPEKKPKDLKELLKLLFPNNLERQKLALLLLMRVHKAEKTMGFDQKSGWDLSWNTLAIRSSLGITSY